MIIKTNVLLPHACCFCSQILLICLDLKYFDIERYGRRLFLKYAMCTKFNIYVFITITGSIPLLVDY